VCEEKKWDVCVEERDRKENSKKQKEIGDVMSNGITVFLEREMNDKNI